jgi:hypothetical protein
MATYQLGICLNLGVINYCWKNVERIKYTGRWGLSIVKEENDKYFQKTLNRDLARNDDSGLWIFEVGVEIVRCIYDRLGMVPRVNPNTTPNLKCLLAASQVEVVRMWLLFQLGGFSW